MSLQTLDNATRRVLNIKARMGLLDDPYRSLNKTRETEDRFMPKHETLALDVATRSVVMLKNERGTLPLRKTGQKIALVGWWSEDTQNAEGCGVIWGNKSFVVSLAAGINEVMGDPTNENWLRACIDALPILELACYPLW